jgi:hypothetical protein
MLNLLRACLAVRLTLSFLLASLVPVLGGGWLARAALERSTRRDAEERQELIASAATALVDETLARAEEKLTTMGRLLGGELASWEGGEEHGSAEPASCSRGASASSSRSWRARPPRRCRARTSRCAAPAARSPSRALREEERAPLEGDAALLAEDTAFNRAHRYAAVHAMLAAAPLTSPRGLTGPLFRELLHVDLDDPFLGLAPDVVGGRLGRHGPAGPLDAPGR